MGNVNQIVIINNFIGLNGMDKTILKSVITCPNCNFSKEEIMPVDACLHFYECKNCGILLKPKEGDCCVFCSYGSVKCPPIQKCQ
jgi:rubredoxin